MSEPQRNIDALLSEQRTFPPPQAFRDHAVVGDPAVYETAAADHEAFWAEQAGRLAWSRPWDSVMERDAPWVTWFKGGRLNASVNCLDRHIEAGGGDKVAFLWEGEPGDARAITYAELLEEVCRLANALRALGIRKGDRVNIYLGHDPRAPDRDARVRADRRPAFGRVRRLQRRSLAGPDQRRRGQGPDHRRRRLAPWTGRSAEGERGRGGSRSARRSSTWSPCAGAGTSMPSPRVATTGTTISSLSSRRRASRRTWKRKICSTCSTRAARPASPRGSCTRPAAT